MLNESDVEWIVNDASELGVRINGQCFFLYKGKSLEYKEGRYRPVWKREFGECCHPWDFIKKQTGEERLPKNYEDLDRDEPEYASEWKDI